MVLRLLRALPGVSGLLASVARGIITRELDPSVEGTGPHGLTVRFSAHHLTHQERPSHPASRLVTIGLTSLVSRRDVDIRLFPIYGKKNIFARRA